MKISELHNLIREEIKNILYESDTELKNKIEKQLNKHEKEIIRSIKQHISKKDNTSRARNTDILRWIKDDASEYTADLVNISKYSTDWQAEVDKHNKIIEDWSIKVFKKYFS